MSLSSHPVEGPQLLSHRWGQAGSWTVTVRESGARLAVESADAASAHGHLPFLVIADEVAQWPTTRAARALWEALVSGLPKRTDSRLAVLTTAGDPAHWSAKVLDAARTSDRWRVSEVPGSLPRADPDDLAEQARLLPASAYARLHLNRWTAAEDGSPRSRTWPRASRSTAPSRTTHDTAT